MFGLTLSSGLSLSVPDGHTFCRGDASLYALCLRHNRHRDDTLIAHCCTLMHGHVFKPLPMPTSAVLCNKLQPTFRSAETGVNYLVAGLADRLSL